MMTIIVETDDGVDGAVKRLPLVVAINEKSYGELIPSYGVHAGMYGDYVELFGTRVRASDGAVVYADIAASKYWVLDGLEWTMELWSDPAKAERFVKAVVEELHTYLPSVSASRSASTSTSAPSRGLTQEGGENRGWHRPD